MSCLGFGLDVQVIFLSVEAVAGYPTDDIWVGIRGVSWLSREVQKPRRSRGCVRGDWSQHYPYPPGRTDTEESGVVKGYLVTPPSPPHQDGQR